MRRFAIWVVFALTSLLACHAPGPPAYHGAHVDLGRPNPFCRQFTPLVIMVIGGDRGHSSNR